MCTKNEKERYAKVGFKDGAFDFTKFKYVRIGKDDHIREISANYYRTHSDSIDWTYAGEIKRKLINNGFIV